MVLSLQLRRVRKKVFLAELLRQLPDEVDQLAEGGTFWMGSDNIQNRAQFRKISRILPSAERECRVSLEFSGLERWVQTRRFEDHAA